MPRSRPVYAPEFRRQMVELVRAGRSPEELSREFEPPTQHGEPALSVLVAHHRGVLARGEVCSAGEGSGPDPGCPGAGTCAPRAMRSVV